MAKERHEIKFVVHLVNGQMIELFRDGGPLKREPQEIAHSIVLRGAYRKRFNGEHEVISPNQIQRVTWFDNEIDEMSSRFPEGAFSVVLRDELVINRN